MSQLSDFINTMIKITVTLGGISFALLFFIFRVYSEKLEKYIKEREHLTMEERIAHYFQIVRYRITLFSNTLSAIIFLIGPWVIVLLYYTGLLDSNSTAISLIGTYSIGILLLMVPLRLFLPRRPEV